MSTPASPVYVFGEARTPIYHWPGHFRHLLDTPTRGQHVYVTACGKVVWRATRENSGPWRYDDDAVRLRADWAAKIGRPCGNCERAR